MIDISSSASQYTLLSWETDRGLPQNSVQAIAQTPDGFLWVGTKEGLARFDGVEFTVFHPNDTPELPDQSITTLSVAPDGSLWIGTEGIGLVRMKHGVFTRFARDQGMTQSRIRALRHAPDGSLWVASGSTVERFKDGRFINYTREDSLRSSVRAMWIDRSGAAWVGTGNGTRVIRDGKITTPASDEELRSNTIRAIFGDHAGSRWSATTSEIVRENDTLTRYDSKAGLGPRSVQCIFEDSRRTLWFGTSEGLYRFERERFVRETAKGGLANDSILTIFEDREGNIWLGTNDGLKQLRATLFSSYTTVEGLSHNVVNTVCEDAEGALWVSTMGGGLIRWRNGEKIRYSGSSGLVSSRVLAVHPARDGSLWIGFEAATLCRLKDGEVFSYSYPEQMTTGHTLALLQDRTGLLWVGTKGGLARLENDVLVPASGSLGPIRVQALAEGSAGELWIGTDEGLMCHVGGKPASPAASRALGKRNIKALHADRDGVLWIGTERGGLFWIKDGKLNACSSKQGLLSNTILEIVEDDVGFIWMTSRQGIFRVAKQALHRIADGTAIRVECAVYGKGHGLIGVEGSSAAKPGAWKGRDGRLWFATLKGLLVVDPARATTNRIPPPVVITGVEVDRERVVWQEGMRLPPGRGELQFHFTAFSFAEPEKVRFKYRLAGVDHAWVDAGSRRIAHYSGVKPGWHRFEVLAQNNDGVWSESPAKGEFHLAPRFHQTWGFYLLVGALGLCTACGAYRWRLRSLRRREQVLETMVRERTAETIKAQRELLEISRQAGMAEVATGVLHNVGNVLNSVNVSATLVADRMRTSKAADITRLGDLLRKNESNLADFLTRDERGRRVPNYVVALGRQVAAEQQETTRELECLRKNVDHIKEIVAMQQSYARVAGVAENIAIVDLVEDALRMNAGSNPRDEVTLVRDYQAKPAITVEKHKVLQILVNLVRNAKQACAESVQPGRTITVRVRQTDTRVEIQIIDNGVGIPVENITRVFAHGFTTKKTGHGFGLHSGALVARELGGNLQVHSEGHGKGAAFTLALPFAPNRARPAVAN